MLQMSPQKLITHSCGTHVCFSSQHCKGEGLNCSNADIAQITVYAYRASSEQLQCDDDTVFLQLMFLLTS
jgi:hypothetical protein